MKHLLNDRDLAEWLGFKQKTVRNRVCSGDDMPPHIQIGRTRRWDPKDVQEWLETRRVREVNHG